MSRRLASALPVALAHGGGRSWFDVAMRTDVTNEAVVRIYDEIGMWGVSAQAFAEELAALDVSEITLRVNSPGGSVFDGVTIYNAIRNHRANVTAHVDGLAASAASFIVQAADEVVMQPGSVMMIHEAAGLCFGPASEMRALADLLDKLSANIADLYAARAGQTQAHWLAAMAATTWYNASEAVDAGLADRVDGTDAPPAMDDAQARWRQSLMAQGHGLGEAAKMVPPERVRPNPDAEVDQEWLAGLWDNTVTDVKVWLESITKP